MFKKEDLIFFAKQGFNVLFEGAHGVGKTEMVKEVFDELFPGRWLYFSASTMDPWVDFIGIPREVKSQDGHSYLDLIRPRVFAEDQVEAIMMDETNRAPKKVRNAIMELIQFRSINGKRFNNLKVIWGAINPADDEENNYDVEQLDPAQADRFQIHLKVPYRCNLKFFTKKYGSLGEDAVAWWNELPDNEKKKVSPRRLEYALQMHGAGGNLRFVLPDSSNVKKLVENLNKGSIDKRMRELLEKENVTDSEISEFFRVENNYTPGIKLVIQNPQWMSMVLHNLEPEKLSSLMAEYSEVIRYVENNKNAKFEEIAQEIINAGTNKAVANLLKNHIFVNDYNLNTTQDRIKRLEQITSFVDNKQPNEEDLNAIFNDIDVILEKSKGKTVTRNKGKFDECFEKLYDLCLEDETRLESLKAKYNEMIA